MTGSSLNKRKIAVLGSRSVGQDSLHFVCNLVLNDSRVTPIMTGKSSLVKQFIEVGNLDTSRIYH